MNRNASVTSVVLETLERLLAAAGLEPANGAQVVSASQLPPECAALLDHHDHMTTRLAEHYGAPVQLSVRGERQRGDDYTRHIVLTLEGTGRAVEVGVVRIALNLVPSAVRDEVLAKAAPLGDILIRHDVLREIEPRGFVRFAARDPLPAPLTDSDAGRSGICCGRVGIIHCGGQPAIELLEIVRSD